MGDATSTLQTNPSEALSLTPGIRGGVNPSVDGCSRCSAAPIASISDEACARDTPGFRRAPAVSSGMPRSSRTRGSRSA